MKKNKFLLFGIGIFIIIFLIFYFNFRIIKTEGNLNIKSNSYLLSDLEGNIYTGFNTPKLYSFSSNLKSRWEKTFSSEILFGYLNGENIIFTTNNGKLYILNKYGDIILEKEFDLNYILLMGKVADNKFLAYYEDENNGHLGELNILNGKIKLKEISMYLLKDPIYKPLKIYTNDDGYSFFIKGSKRISQYIIKYDNNVPYIYKTNLINIYFLKDEKKIFVGWPEVFDDEIIYSIENKIYIYNVIEKKQREYDLKGIYPFEGKPFVNSDFMCINNKIYFISSLGDLIEFDGNNFNKVEMKIKSYYPKMQKDKDKLYIIDKNRLIIYNLQEKRYKEIYSKELFYDIKIINNKKYLLSYSKILMVP